MIQPTLKPIDLTLGKDHKHPDIRTDRTFYLVKIGGQWFGGHFEDEWYGLFFDTWLPGSIGHQYDQPGTNHSTWQEVWEVVGLSPEDPEKFRLPGDDDDDEPCSECGEDVDDCECDFEGMG